MCINYSIPDICICLSPFLKLKKGKKYSLECVFVLMCLLQIGSRITSKRICQMLEDCFPCKYIYVDEHPLRHDPSHLVTHRIQSTITEFADCLLKAYVPKISGQWCGLLRALDKVVWALVFLFFFSVHNFNLLPSEIPSLASFDLPYSATFLPVKSSGCSSTSFHHQVCDLSQTNCFSLVSQINS